MSINPEDITFRFSDKPYKKAPWWRHPLRRWRMRHVKPVVFGPLED